ncbi:unnamed protein product [Lactuca virosa]|uniref:Uncharacterized protein n=1 Tax=Lactuca virosa TaxID=75947 RepID=A0AAU9NEH8_9ASTR|nr:unnamed protein product [Lactuca virosa]
MDTLLPYPPGNLILFPEPNGERKPEIRHVEGDSVSVTFVECDLDFNDLTGYHPRNCDMFYPLVPLLGRATKVSDYLTVPLFSVQVTLFPNSGISIGLTNHHSLCDASTRYNFLKAWSSIAKHGTDEFFLASKSLPFYERVITYPSSLDELCLNIPGIPAINMEYQPPHLVSPTDKVRATIVLTQDTSIGLRNGNGDDDLERFVCAVDWRSRLDPPVPQTYFGNCVGASITPTIKSTILAGENGFLTAAELFGKALSETLKKKNGVIEDGETLIKTAFMPIPGLSVSGTPRTKIYDVDFGWGKPKKHETISIDYNSSISVNASKESHADIEIGSTNVDLSTRSPFFFVSDLGNSSRLVDVLWI